jgi:hypothetical protein
VEPFDASLGSSAFRDIVAIVLALLSSCSSESIATIAVPAVALRLAHGPALAACPAQLRALRALLSFAPPAAIPGPTPAPAPFLAFDFDHEDHLLGAHALLLLARPLLTPAPVFSTEWPLMEGLRYLTVLHILDACIAALVKHAAHQRQRLGDVACSSAEIDEASFEHLGRSRAVFSALVRALIEMAVDAATAPFLQLERLNPVRAADIQRRFGDLRLSFVTGPITTLSGFLGSERACFVPWVVPHYLRLLAVGDPAVRSHAVELLFHALESHQAAGGDIESCTARAIETFDAFSRSRLPALPLPPTDDRSGKPPWVPMETSPPTPLLQPDMHVALASHFSERLKVEPGALDGVGHDFLSDLLSVLSLFLSLSATDADADADADAEATAPSSCSGEGPVDPTEDARARVLIELASFLQTTGRPELCLRYLRALEELHLGLGNAQEAGLVRALCAAFVPWATDVPAPIDPDVLSEALCQVVTAFSTEIVDLPVLDAALTQIEAVPTRETQLLRAAVQFSLCQDYERVAAVLNTVAARALAPPVGAGLVRGPDLTLASAAYASYAAQLMLSASNDRVFPSLYLVRAYGASVPPDVRDRSFVYRTATTERLPDFLSRLRLSYPGYEIVSAYAPPTDEQRAKDGKFLQVITVQPSRFTDLVHSVNGRWGLFSCFYPAPPDAAASGTSGLVEPEHELSDLEAVDVLQDVGLGWLDSGRVFSRKTCRGFLAAAAAATTQSADYDPAFDDLQSTFHAALHTVLADEAAYIVPHASSLGGSLPEVSGDAGLRSLCPTTRPLLSPRGCDVLSGYHPAPMPPADASHCFLAAAPKRVREAVRAASHVSLFTYRRTWRSGTEKKVDNEFKDMHNTVYFISVPGARSFPGIERRQAVVEESEFVIRPIELAVEALQQKNVSIRGCTDKHRRLLSRKMLSAGEMGELSMLLNGVIDAAVNGGVYKYADAFFRPEYVADNPADADLVADLREALEKQMGLLADGLVVHGISTDPGLSGMQHKLETFFEKMKEDMAAMKDGQF